MRRTLVIMLILLMTALAQARMLKVGVIDSGYTGASNHLCSTGHRDFTEGKALVGSDARNHGSTIVSAIEANAKDSNYCIEVYKVFGGPKVNSTFLIVKAIDYAVAHNVMVLNLSLEGGSPCLQEERAIANALAKGVTVFVAAGNAGKSLDVKCDVYPACYHLKGLHIVGSSPVPGRIRTGNTGSIITQKEDFCFDGLCGTSLSTAIATGKFVNNKEKRP